MRKFAQKQDQTQKGNSINRVGAGGEKVKPVSDTNPILQLQHTIGNQAVLRMLQSQGQETDMSKPQARRKANESEADSNVKEIKDIQQQTGTQKEDRNENSDEAVHWWAPFGERIAKWGFGGIVTFINIDRKTIGEYTGPWNRNAFDAGVFAVGTGIVTEVVLKRLKLADMIARAIGYGIGFGLAYEGLDVRERIRCKTIDSYSWYGRYRYNYANNEILAVEYWDKGATEKNMISPVYFEQAIVDADGKVLFVNTDEVSYLGIHLDAKSTTLPLFSYGKVDQD